MNSAHSDLRTNTAIHAEAGAGGPTSGGWLQTLSAAALWIVLSLTTVLWPEEDPAPYGREFAALVATVGAALVVVGVFGARSSRLGARAQRAAPWFAALGAALIGWEILTAKTGVLPLPFFASPQGVLEVYFEDLPRLSESVGRSLLLLVEGFTIGSLIGCVTGVALGWSRTAGYWIHPLLRLIGPLPATAWVPLAFFLFPTSGSASVFLIALAAFFPVTVLTWSGVAGVNRDYYDIARTLGADRWFLILKVAIPAALPHVFVGLFMALGASFAVLVVAEMLGVKAGLGWYLQWAQGWAAYANMYAALLLMALMCSGSVTILFRVRDRVLSWQKGLVRW
jgi:NitT/TauT family transport system permease protein